MSSSIINDDQYKALCDNQCGNVLHEHEQIHIFTKGNQEQTWCDDCFQDVGGDMKKNGWTHDEEDEGEWSETCECGVLCGGKVFHNEEEFDKHPDREPGYNADGEWQCEDCRGEDEDSTSKCEDCGYIGDSVIVHDWGCVALCEVCSNKDGEPHCPRTSRSGEAEQCEYCVAQWKEEDE